MLWNELTNLAFSRDKPWFLTGDFNDIIENSEKTGGPARSEGSFGEFRAFISQCDLYDISHSGNCLSWRGVRYSHLIHCRLDRAFSNSSWAEKFPSSRCYYLDFEGSDHRPLLSILEPNLKKKKGNFRYDRSMRNNPEISKIFEDSWNANSADLVEERIANCRRAISHWNREHHLNSQKAIKQEKENLEEAMSSATQDQGRIDLINVNLKTAYKKRRRILEAEKQDHVAGFRRQKLGIFPRYYQRKKGVKQILNHRE